MAFMAIALHASCSDKGDDHSGDFGQIKVPDTRQLEQTVTADDTQAAQGVTFTTEGAWTSSIAETRAGAPAWITISPDHGDAAGSYTLKITLQPNDSKESRTAKIVISCGTSKIEITVTQEGTGESGEGDDPQPVKSALISRLDFYQSSTEPGYSGERWASSYLIEYDAQKRVSAFKWDDTPDNTADEMDEIITFTYPDAATINMKNIQGENKGQSFTISLDNAGRAVEARFNGRSDRWTFGYNSAGQCIECRQYGVSGSNVCPLSTFEWTNGNLTAFNTFKENGDKTEDESYVCPYTSLSNDPAAMNLDLNAICCQVYPGYRPVYDADIAGILSCIGRLGKRSANLADMNTDGIDMPVSSIVDENGVPVMMEYYELTSEIISWQPVETGSGRIKEYRRTSSLEKYRKYIQTGKTEKIDGGYTDVERCEIHYTE